MVGTSQCPPAHTTGTNPQVSVGTPTDFTSRRRTLLASGVAVPTVVAWLSQADVSRAQQFAQVVANSPGWLTAQYPGASVADAKNGDTPVPASSPPVRCCTVAGAWVQLACQLVRAMSRAEHTP